jgi:predicted nuclease of predicted toxin-antitoxin system
MKFLIDNALSPDFAKGIQDAGYDVIHIRDLGLKDAFDPVVFDCAASEDRILISADTDFGTLLAFRHTAKPSVIIFRCRDKHPTNLLTMFLSYISQIQEALEKGSVVVFEEKRIRIRYLPIIK